MKKKGRVIFALIIAIILIFFCSPTRAIKFGALIQDCEWNEVISAKFEKKDDESLFPFKVVYETDSSLCDKMTGSGHSTWYVYRILFINIPVWAGNG